MRSTSNYCRACRKVVYPEVSELVDNCHFGVRFLLYITYLRYVMNLPYNKMVKLLNDTYQAGVSEGTIVSYIQEGGRNLWVGVRADKAADEGDGPIALMMTPGNVLMVRSAGHTSSEPPEIWLKRNSHHPRPT